VVPRWMRHVKRLCAARRTSADTQLADGGAVGEPRRIAGLSWKFPLSIEQLKGISTTCLHNSLKKTLHFPLEIFTNCWLSNPESVYIGQIADLTGRWRALIF
jgi:hypothetical protein